MAGEMPTRIRVSIGPEVGNVTAMQVENVVRDAHRKGYALSGFRSLPSRGQTGSAKTRHGRWLST